MGVGRFELVVIIVHEVYQTLRYTTTITSVKILVRFLFCFIV